MSKDILPDDFWDFLNKSMREEDVMPQGEMQPEEMNVRTSYNFDMERCLVRIHFSGVDAEMELLPEEVIAIALRLLQTAHMAQMDEMVFDICRNRLPGALDGVRPFTEADVEALSDILGQQRVVQGERMMQASMSAMFKRMADDEQ